MKYPLKLGVVTSTIRSWSSSILKKGQFSQPASLNCLNQKNTQLRKANQTLKEERNRERRVNKNLIIGLDESATKTSPKLMAETSRNLSWCASHYRLFSLNLFQNPSFFLSSSSKRSLFLNWAVFGLLFMGFKTISNNTWILVQSRQQFGPDWLLIYILGRKCLGCDYRF